MFKYEHPEYYCVRILQPFMLKWNCCTIQCNILHDTPAIKNSPVSILLTGAIEQTVNTTFWVIIKVDCMEISQFTWLSDLTVKNQSKWMGEWLLLLLGKIILNQEMHQVVQRVWKVFFLPRKYNNECKQIYCI